MAVDLAIYVHIYPQKMLSDNSDEETVAMGWLEHRLHLGEVDQSVYFEIVYF